ncbi:hypothetical protein RA263_14550 [Pseudomonas syringae pv. tagetis]|uniref:Putative prophage PSSB64-02, Orf53 n=1 Tax=Pseudomonas syringae pv. tagetis TaxID=129140 RepID=A0A0Q0AX42_9PSED|nr:hypothetical protein [Pseudomonas syringae group genomosp. 7]KPY83739.1 putative prophage PSSB64-02, Orf53 [Pseudomonas syringae pv. tagetis]RMW08832.1 hypothetical protein ALO98_200203 [Pseudomonas syringae pv. tagetis]RMW25832.1 putative prophage PSSB64-02, Orf53 [Pseudomonas syringae pv. tagetis]UNB70259.1 hypothetical protein MME58_08575 [Pseudomonas syringae pv. tagetis]
MSEAQQVITIDDISADNAPAIYVTGGLNQFLQAVTAEVTAEVPDLTTRKGRDRIASLAAKVSKSKTAVEKPGRDYLKRLKEMPKVVETELREFVTKMDALRDATRKPLTDWEEANDRRIDAHNDGIQRIKDMAVFAEMPTAAHVAQIIADLELVEINDSWEEFLPEAAQAKDRSLATLRTLLADRTKHEAELAEIAKFKAEKAEREQKDRDAEIARQAVERAQRELDQKAQAEREAAAKREQELIDQAAQARRDAEQKQRDADAAAENQALQLKLAAEREERQKLQAEQDRIAAEQRQAAAVERARLDEISRQEQEAAEARRIAEAREADKAHIKSVCLAAQQAMVSLGVDEACAKAVIILIHQKKIPAITINY